MHEYVYTYAYLHKQRLNSTLHERVRAPFLVAISLAFSRGVYEICAVVVPVVVLSITYHKNHEKYGWVSIVDGVCAKMLFVYKIAHMQQIYANMASMKIFACMLALSITTTTAHVFTYINRQPHMYELVHPIGLHVLPGVWCILVAIYCPPLFLI